MVNLKIILCPTDFSELSAYALEYARSLAETYGAKLHLLHVVDEAYQYWMGMSPEGIAIGPPPEEILAASRNSMTRFVESQWGVAPDYLYTEVRLGRPFVDIIRYARDIGADLIVLGTHGRSGLSHVLLGSVTEKVVRKSPCPVLTVRPPSQSFEIP